MKNNSALLKTLNVLENIVLTVVVVVAASFIVFTFAFGGKLYTVITGSMTPNINPGDMVAVIEPKNGVNDIKVGDVVVFQPESGNPDVITHRVISVNYTKQEFVTQGDANNMNDGKLIKEQLRGKVIGTIPYVGKGAMFVRNHPIAVFATLGVLIAGRLSLGAIFSKKRGKEAQAQEVPKSSNSGE